MIRILKTELRRGLFNKWMIFSMLVTIVMCFMQFSEVYESRMMYFETVKELGYYKSLNICGTTAYEQWFLFGFSMEKYIFMYIMPILAVLPFGISYYADVKSGYVKQMVSRVSMKSYTKAKYLATFISGGVAVTAPLLLDFLVTATVFPLHEPLRFDNRIYGEYSYIAGIFFEHPMVYTLIKFILVFIVAGLMATIALLVSKYISNLFSVFITPFVVAFSLEFMTYITANNNLCFSQNLQADTYSNEMILTLLVEIVVLFAVTYFGFVGSKKEVY